MIKKNPRIYLWLFCEGWCKFGPYEWLRFDEDGSIVDQDGNVIAKKDQNRPVWKTIETHSMFEWSNPTINTSLLHPHPNSGAHPKRQTK